jgi:4-hydroxy-tetrahydrodipicolinate reductase
MAASGATVYTPLNFIVWGTGRMGVECTRAALARGDLRPVAAIVTDPLKDGRDLGEICDLGGPLGAIASTDADSVLRRPDVDVVFVCGFAYTAGVAEMMRRASSYGKDAITYSGLVHPATALGTTGARDLDRFARENGTRMLGTGWLGYFTDALPVALATLSVDWSVITVTVVQPMDHWSMAAIGAYGIGHPPAVYEIESDRLSPLEAVGAIADALGVEVIDLEIEQTPVAADAVIEGRVIVEPGQTRGVRKRFSVSVTGGREIILDWTFIYGLTVSGGWKEQYVIDIEGISSGAGVHAEFSGGWSPDPYPSTAACGVNAVHRLRSLPPGLYSMAQVPSAVPRHDWPTARL